MPTPSDKPTPAEQALAAVRDYGEHLPLKERCAYFDAVAAGCGRLKTVAITLADAAGEFEPKSVKPRGKR